MSTLLSVDPGIRGCGVAIFRYKILTACAYVENPARKGHGLHECMKMAWAVGWWWREIFGTLGCVEPSELICEFPQVYRIGGGRTKGDPNDLLPLAAVDGAIAADFDETVVHHVLPAEWKGQVSKDAVRQRVESRLTEDEKMIVRTCGVRPALLHNVIDGIGIGLHFLGRFERCRALTRM